MLFALKPLRSGEFSFLLKLHPNTFYNCIIPRILSIHFVQSILQVLGMNFIQMIPQMDLSEWLSYISVFEK
ncbi:unnamed protein product [Rotaria socialis]|uniref:Uncharacterized protein n=1 Tax=Rotaria socialis TaxID=392032 RepID=A0A821RD31_9BILA|nr:unnamed protein product [Rotaria socialis]